MQPSSILILAASARTDGNTIYAIERLRSKLTSASFIDITALNLRGFDYRPVDEADGFLPIIEAIIAHRTIIFATPVYWYAMSGPMKIFFDRLSDLLVQPALRPTGRALAGREVWLLTSGTDTELPAGFTEPFMRTSAYFGMRWRDSCYVRAIDDDRPSEAELQKIDDFAAVVLDPPSISTP